ncbi:MAG: response regulator [Verrucomicrobia bacterium]|nr:response regulator [Verrucomicrobiota bacterium]
MPDATTEKRILVVDDDVGILRLVRETLTTFLVCTVDTTPSPEYAFELVLKKPFDLLLFDFQMPMVDGALLYNLIGKVYALALQPPRRLPPLLLMSGHGEQARAQALLHEPGVRGLLPKPFTIERLLGRVEGALPAHLPGGGFARRHELR